ncbi:hypothetical protein [Phytohabitans kaempferiae]|uniref:Uncharacterized protein n=1 Tax=Phytohabitans kaempferiae TaxID=1620943 RepID=A0ABV6LYW4_9ACTN
MALAMDPERRRMLMAVDKAQREWEERYGIDDADWVAGGKTGPDRVSPTPEQAEELHRALNRITHWDPETGRYGA